MTPEQLQAIKERVEKATVGPWRLDLWDGLLISGFTKRVVLKGGQGKAIKAASEDINFIAHAREDVPVLVAEVERLQQEKEALEFQLKVSINHAETVAEELEVEVAENERLREALEDIQDIELNRLASYEEMEMKRIAAQVLEGDSND